MCLEQGRSIAALKAEWDALPDDQQVEIIADFEMACVDGSREPSEHWYRLLMPMFMKDYVGD